MVWPYVPTTASVEPEELDGEREIVDSNENVLEIDEYQQQSILPPQHEEILYDRE